MGKPESPVGMVEIAGWPGQKHRGFLEGGLLLLLLLVTGALVALGLLYAANSRGKQLTLFPSRLCFSKEEKTIVKRKPRAIQEPKEMGEICTTPGCVIAASRILQNMDPSREPCEDFYQYACGGWLRRHVIPETNSRYSVFDILRDELEVILKGVLENATTQDRPAVQKAKMLYRSCMNQSVIEKRDSQPLLNILDVMGGWPVTMDKWNQSVGPKWELEQQLALMNTQFNRRVLIDLFIWNDDQNSSRHIIYIDQPTLGMPSREYYFNEGSNRKVREAYLQFMMSVAMMLRADMNLPENSYLVREDMVQVLELETQLANATAPQEERHDVTALYHRMGLKELQSKFSLKGFNWTLFIQSVLSSVKIKLLPDEEVVVYGIPYLQNLEEIIDVYSARTMQNYLVWRLVLDRISSLSQRFKDARANYRKALYGTTVEEVRWRECVSYVNSNMESAVGSLYVREAFPGDSKDAVRELIDKVRAVFVETLDELGWMDEESKKKAQEKAMNIREQIGYPDYILEERNKHLDEEYSNLNFSEDQYFENGLQNLKAGAQRSLKKLREKVDQNLWIIGAAVVNAFYSPNRNQIVFPAGILQPPFFSKHQPQALNFGGIGMVIGHEITHGFDDNGRNFDKNGNMLDWWSNFSAQHFREQSECMVHQYGNYSWDLADNQNVNGFSTLGENIADNGGVRQAYKAYLKWMAEGGKDQQLPGLGLTYNQLFFINYAQVWCGSYRPEFAIQSIKTDVHSPLKYRVLGSLQNLAAFSEAFHCAQGSPMHPHQRCRVW
ncbi:membrane metallo-endopeptidase-like 1 isoform X12 [Canis lupus familiaris]|uniref:Membrane metalloendopeptidase like 1 n=1 Tax=Canis lupus familiaris TaxID=9615 RepID=A0A8C0QDL7_CANLF|nr:membrane metallo-endopeptidase-like 1 isoform X12 [Canis lupus familiaris]XP_038393648.1 membrane metallo-endopeptidase-like 1 isoform X12 [Canis lupus familiaris]XP_038522396.1 membrane metallo-endopeptidase-like 1 isoform X12 [Canis lupus familiaris]|eukprot:XP_022274655.1 membrane metallo-endopeptidase-like 1 isoform X13 [Canis lupus familiaris]